VLKVVRLWVKGRKGLLLDSVKSVHTEKDQEGIQGLEPINCINDIGTHSRRRSVGPT
jgi:hypothetical protein